MRTKDLGEFFYTTSLAQYDVLKYYVNKMFTPAMDVVALLQLIATYKPKTFLEIGTNQGQTTQIIADNFPNMQIVTCDPGDQLTEEQRNEHQSGEHLPQSEIGARVAGYPNVKVIKKAFADIDWGGQTFDFIFIDGDHSYEAALQDSLLAAKLVNHPGVLAWHDVDNGAVPGVKKALDELTELAPIIHIEKTMIGYRATCRSTDSKRVFTQLHRDGAWGSGCGPGATLDFCQPLINFLTPHFAERKVKTLCDLGCGDFQWQPSLVANTGVKYIGVDCIDALIEQNSAQYPRPAYEFRSIDFAATPAAQLPEADVYLIKDVLQHWTSDDVNQFLVELLIARPSAEVLVINCVNQETDKRDIQTGQFEPLNKSRYPLNEFNVEELFAFHSKVVYRISPSKLNTPAPIITQAKLVAAPAALREFSAALLQPANVAAYRPLVESTSAQWFAEAAAAAALVPQASDMDGRGIVICAGNNYLPAAWVNVKMLRYFHCDLPIEIWHLGPEEIPDRVRPGFEALGVTFIDGREIQKTFPHQRLNGWELKAYALLHTKFAEVMLLDADNIPLKNVTRLFDEMFYKQHGALFWPDRGTWPPHAKIWELTGVPYRPECEFETGQMVVDRARCWPAVVMTNWINEESVYWYTKIHGDKDTFRLGWRGTGTQYNAIPHSSLAPWPFFYQKDITGDVLFQHGCKWSGDPASCELKQQFTPEFVPYYPQCVGYIEEYSKL